MTKQEITFGVRLTFPTVPLTEAEVDREAQRIRDALSKSGTAYISQDFLNRCEYDDCLRLLELLPIPNLSLNVPIRPRNPIFFSLP